MKALHKIKMEEALKLKDIPIFRVQKVVEEWAEK